MPIDATDSARLPDLNGWFEIKDNPISKEGVFDYSGASIGAPEPNRIYKVYRPAEELSHPDCINSFKLTPFINDHTMLGDKSEGLTPAENKGVHGVIGENVKFENGILKGNLKVFSSKLAKIIADGKKELSLGYRCIYEFVNGVYDGQHYDAIQRNIRGNHLALVDKGRMGKDVAVLDHLKFTIDSKEIEKMEIEKLVQQQGEAIEKLTKVCASLDEAVKEMKKEVEVSEEDKKAAADKKAADEEAEKKAAEGCAIKKAAGMDEKLKAVQDELESIKKGGIKSLISEVSKRDALAKNLAPHIGSFDASEKTLSEVAKYGVEKLGITCADGQEEVALAGFLHNRKNPSANSISLDKKVESNEIAAYLAKSE